LFYSLCRSCQLFLLLLSFFCFRQTPRWIFVMFSHLVMFEIPDFIFSFYSVDFCLL
jgi:hypothetical protein